MKIFISMPMANKSKEDILVKRKEIIDYLTNTYGNDIEILDSYFKSFDSDDSVNKPLLYLAKSIEVLSKANLAVFAEGWDKARGCKIEYDCANAYGIKIKIM